MSEYRYHAINDTYTSLPAGVQLGSTWRDPDTQYKYQLLLTNSGLTQAPASGMPMASVSGGNPFVVEVCGASGSTNGGGNLLKCACIDAPGSGVYFWGMIEGYQTNLPKNSGTPLTAGMTLAGTTSFSGAWSGTASGTANVSIMKGFVTAAYASGTTAFSGTIQIGTFV